MVQIRMFRLCTLALVPFVLFMLLLFISSVTKQVQSQNVTQDDFLVLRSHTVQFQSIKHDKRRGLKVMDSIKLMYLRIKEGNNNTAVVVGTQTQGFYGYLERNIYLVEQDSVAYLSLTRNEENGEYVPLLPEYKYNPSDYRNETKFMIQTSHAMVYNAFKNCTLKQIRKIQSKVYIVKCDAPNLMEQFANHPNVVHIDLLPRLIRHDNVAVENQNSPNTSIPVSALSAGPLNFVAYTTVLVTDSGCDITHCAFQYGKPIVYLNMTDKLSSPNSHGTSTSSVAVGTQCIPGVYGYAAAAPFVFGDISTSGESIDFPDNFFDLFFHTVDIHIHSASWGDSLNLGLYTLISSTFDDYIFHHQQTLHVIAAGNAYGQASGAPGTSKNGISVGALNPDLETIASFTSTGDLEDGRESPLIYAPGVNILTAKGRQYPPGDYSNTEYTLKDGTSFSTPGIAGIAAVEYDRYRKTFGYLPHSNSIGAMMLNRYGKHNLPFKQPQSLNTVVSRNILANGLILPEPQRVQAICFRAVINTDVFVKARFTMRYYDVAALAYSAHPLINDLDMLFMPYTTSDILISETDLYVHETVSTFVENGETYRILVYAYGNQTFSGPLNFSIHGELFDTDGDFVLLPSNECGTCFPGTTRACGQVAGAQQQQCLPSGLWSTCSACETGLLPLNTSDPDNECICEPYMYVLNDTGYYSSACPVPYTSESNFKPVTSSGGGGRSVPGVSTPYKWFIAIMCLYVIL